MQLENERNSTLGRIDVADLESEYPRYIAACEAEESRNTTATRQVFIGRLLWFLNAHGHRSCGPAEIVAFFAYLRHGHEQTGGRWGKNQPRYCRPMRPISRRDYYVALHSFFNWLQIKGWFRDSPMADIPKPKAPDEIKPPLAEEQILRLFRAARHSSCPRRDEAVLAFFLDTGCRVSEVASILVGDADLDSGRAEVLGKGDKKRTTYLREQTVDALKAYLQETGRSWDDPQFAQTPLFVSTRTHKRVTRSGIQQLMKRLARRANIKSSVSPHAMRRTFAVMFLREGANAFVVQDALGHNDLGMTRRYARLAQTDVEDQHRKFSPMQHLVIPGLGGEPETPD